MEQELPLFPEAASHVAPQVDALFFAWSAISIFLVITGTKVLKSSMLRTWLGWNPCAS